MHFKFKMNKLASFTPLLCKSGFDRDKLQCLKLTCVYIYSQQADNEQAQLKLALNKKVMSEALVMCLFSCKYVCK